MKKKTILILFLVLILAVMATPVLAAGSGSVAVSAPATPVGKTVELVYSVEDFGKADTIAVTFTVPEGLKVESGKWLIEGTLADVDEQKQIAVWTANSAVSLQEKTPLFQLTLKVEKKTADPYQVSISANAKLNGEDAAKATAKGSVTAVDAACTHDLVETPAKAPTCLATGNNRYFTCKLCNKVLTADKNVETTVEAQTLPLADHKFGWVVDQWPSESSTGTKHQECSVCHKTKDVGTVIPKLVHTPVLVEGKAPTCQETGVAEHFHCGYCGKYYLSENGKVGKEITKEETVLPLAEHTYGTEWKSDAKSHWHECQCGKTADNESHKAKIVNAVAATETKEGYTGDTVCEVCGYEVAKGEKIPATGTQAPTTQPSIPATKPTEPDEKPEDGSNLPLIICIIAAVAAACAGTALIIIKKRK